MSASITLPYPGHLVQKGEKSKQIVKAVQNQLNRMGCGPVDVDGDFGNQTFNAIGRPLVIDGKIGAITWATLFGEIEQPQQKTSLLLTKVLQIANSQIGILENPKGSNRGPEVDKYLRSVGLNPASGSYAWCAGFVYWTYEQAAAQLNRSNPAVRSAGVLAQWNLAGQKGIPRLLNAEAINDPGKVKPGFIFVIATGGGLGHMGLVESVRTGILTTIEGNTNNNGSREGIGVFKRHSRKVAEINKGFIDYSGL
jgi:hypothetical protein